MVGYAYGGPFARAGGLPVGVRGQRLPASRPTPHRRRAARCTTRCSSGSPSAGYRIAVAGMTLPNDASVGLHRAMGFEPVGTYRRIGWKHGAWHDVAWTQRPLADGLPAGAPR